MRNTQPWIGNKYTDILFVLLPPFASLLLIFIFPSLFRDANAMPDYWWVVLILLIDVAHVYSTLYRTYFDKETFRQQRNRLIAIPLVAFITGVMLYYAGPLIFWKILAYLAVYHFVRQQYGFMRIYARKEKSSIITRRIDAVTIYAATLYPILFWHFSPGRNFNWFVEGDFFSFSNSSIVLLVLGIIYLLILLAYVIEETVQVIRTGYFNVPKNMVVLGTVLSWYFGIVYFNGDLAFTVLNVVSHGIPYMALIWMYGKKTRAHGRYEKNKLLKLTFSKYGIVIFLLLIFVFAYVEEGLWDTTLWKEHQEVFSAFHFSDARPGDALLSLLVPLLALPQITHYVIDAYIWRVRKDELKWSDK